MRNIQRLILMGAALSLAGCGVNGAATPATPAHHHQTLVGSTARWSAPPPMTISANGHYAATVRTNYGQFVITLFAKQDPRAVNNFVFLARHQFYNGDSIFRIIQPFMFQTGDPLNNGTGGPGYQVNAELPVPVPYGPGVVAYAHAQTNAFGSQFFVCTGAECASLNQTPTYTEIGKVTSGMSVLQKIAAVPVTTNPTTGENSDPTQAVTITSITISGS